MTAAHYTDVEAPAHAFDLWGYGAPAAEAFQSCAVAAAFSDPSAILVTYEAGEDLFRAGDLANSVYRISKGTVVSYRLYADGRRQITGFSLPGDVIGLEAGVEYRVHAQALGPVTVRALKRQIATLYFERSGLSRKPEKLATMVKAGAEQAEPRLAIRDPYIFEFLGLRAQDAVEESDLEAALVTHLREFLLELGNGFCLEAQQKSIVIGNTRGFVDLVFYHRVLKCHVLVDLKVDAIRHEHIGQLNTYVTWYRKHMMAEGDNPPVGLLLCTQKDHALVEYALAAIGNRLFVSKYQLELPSKEDLQRFLEEKRREVEDGT